MATLVALGGMEQGSHAGIATGVNTAKYFDRIVGTAGTQVSVNTTSARSGTYGLQINGTAATAHAGFQNSGNGGLLGASGTLVGVFYFKIPTLPTAADLTIFIDIGTAGGQDVFFKYLVSNQRLQAVFGAQTQTSGVTISANTWYRVDFRAIHNANPHTLEWQLDGVVQTTVSLAVATENIFVAGFGIDNATAPANGTFYIDDFAFSLTSGDYPIGPMKVVQVIPDTAATATEIGTANATSRMTTNSALDTTFSSANILAAISEIPPLLSGSSTGWGQRTSGTGNAVNIPMTTYTLGGGESLLGVRINVCTWAASATAAANLLGLRGFNGSIETTLFAAAAYNGVNTTTPSWICKMYAGVTDQTTLNNLQVRLGYSSDISPLPGVHAVYAEVAVKLGATLDVVAIRGYADDAAMGSATPKAAQNVGWTQPLNQNFRIRLEVQNTSANPEATGFKLQHNQNSFGYQDVQTGSTVCVPVASPNVTDGAATADLLTAGTGTFRAGSFDEADGAVASIALGANEHTELEFCIKFAGVDVANNDTFQFRVVRTGLGTIDATSATPTITVGTAGGSGNLPTITSPAQTAQAFTGDKSATLPTVTEADAVQVVTGLKTVPLPVDTDTNTSQVITGAKSGTLPTITSPAQTAQPLTGTRTVSLPTITETDSARVLTTAITSGALVAAIEASSAQALVGVKSNQLAVDTEVNGVQAFVGAKTASLPIISVAESAIAFSGAVYGTLPLISVGEDSRALTGTKAGGGVAAYPAWQSAGYGSTTWAATSGTSKNLLIPSGATVGHLAVIVVGVNGLASNNVTISSQGGWNKKHQTTLTGWGDTFAMIAVFWHKIAAGEPGTNAVITLGAQPRGGASIHTFANAEVDSDPFVDPKVSESASSAQPVSLSVTTPASPGKYALFTVLEKDSVALTATEPSGFTRRHNAGTTNEAGHVAVKENVDAATTAAAWTLSATNRNTEWYAGIKSTAGGGAQETYGQIPPTITLETSQALTGAKTGTLPTVSEADFSSPFTTGVTNYPPVVVETDTAQSLAGAKTGTLPTVTESDSAVAITELPPVVYPALIDGIEPETHCRMGVIQDSNGNLYRIAESLLAEKNQPKMMKSTDQGLTWVEQDATHRPGTDTDSIGDLESGHILWNASTKVATFVWQRTFIAYSSFRTSDHATNPDTWVANTRENMASVTAGTPQYASFTKPTDQAYEWVFYGNTTTKPSYRSRTGVGSYGTQADVDSAGQHPAAVILPNGTDSYVVYKKSSQVHYKKLTSGGTLDSTSTRVDSSGTADASGYDVPFAWPVSYDASGNSVVSVLFCNASEQLKCVDIVNGTPGSEQTVTTSPPAANEGTTTSLQAIISLAVHGTTLHAIWSDAATWDVMHSSRPYGGAWSTPTVLYNTGAGEEVAWVTTAVVTHGGVPYLGYTYDLAPHLDDDSNIYYNRLSLAVSAATLPTVTEVESGQTLTGTKSATLPPVVESDSSQSLSASKSVSVTAIQEVDTVQALVGSKSATLPPVAEPDVSQALTGTRSVTLPVTTSPNVAVQLVKTTFATLPTVTESDSARAVSSTATTVLPVTPEADQSISLVGTKTAALPTVTEADAGQVVTGVKSQSLPTRTETDSAQALTSTRTVPLPTITESDAAQVVTAAKTGTLPTQPETDQSQALLAAKSGSISFVTETDAARPFTSTGQTQLPPVTGLNTAQQLTGSKVAALAPDTEPDQSRPFTATKSATLPTVVETDNAQPLIVSARGLPVISETDAAQPVTGTKSKTLPTVVETDQAVQVTAGKLLPTATETDTSRPLFSTRVGVLPVAAEVDEAVPFLQKPPYSPWTRDAGADLEDNTSGAILEPDVAGVVLEDVTTSATLENNLAGVSALENNSVVDFADNPAGAKIEDNLAGAVILDNHAGSILVNNLAGASLSDNGAGASLPDNPASATLGNNLAGAVIVDNKASADLEENHASAVWDGK